MPQLRTGDFGAFTVNRCLHPQHHQPRIRATVECIKIWKPFSEFEKWDSVLEAAHSDDASGRTGRGRVKTASEANLRDR